VRCACEVARMDHLAAIITYGQRGIPVDRLLLTQSYSHFFASTLHLGRWPPQEVAAVAALTYMQGIGIRSHWYQLLPRACAMLEAAINNGSRVRCQGGPRHPVPCYVFSGLLVFHADFWMNLPSWRRSLSSTIDWSVGWYRPAAFSLSAACLLSHFFGVLTHHRVLRLPRPSGNASNRPITTTGLLNLSSVQSRCHWVQQHGSAQVSTNTTLPMIETLPEHLPVTWHQADSHRTRTVVMALCQTKRFEALAVCRRTRSSSGTVWKLCLSWADMVYTPRDWLADFFHLGGAFYSQKIVHEVAVPTIMHWLAEARGQEQKFVGCSGCCCCTLPANEQLLRDTVCGHRLDLGNPKLRVIVGGLLNETSSADASRAKYITRGLGSQMRTNHSVAMGVASACSFRYGQQA
jgi:hypothetical protein